MKREGMIKKISSVVIAAVLAVALAPTAIAEHDNLPTNNNLPVSTYPKESTYPKDSVWSPPTWGTYPLNKDTYPRNEAGRENG